jgi:hypothetical protein
MDREMLLAMVRRGNFRVRPWGTCIEVDQGERDRLASCLCEQVRGLTETDDFSNLRHLFSKGVPCVRDAAGLQAECVSPVLRMSCSDRKRS